MSQQSLSLTALRIFGDSLIPEEISNILGCAPSVSFIKGQTQQSRQHVIIRKTGTWQLEAAKKEPADLDAQIAEILSRLPKDMAVWIDLGNKYEIDLFCGYFMKGWDEGLDISAKTLKALGDRRIKLSVCLYKPDAEESDDAPKPASS